MCHNDRLIQCPHRKGHSHNGKSAPPKGAIRTLNIESVSECGCPTYILTTGEYGLKQRFTDLPDLIPEEDDIGIYNRTPELAGPPHP